MARGFPYEDLKDFLGALEKAGELHRVTAPVDPTLEVSEIVTRTVSVNSASSGVTFTFVGGAPV